MSEKEIVISVRNLRKTFPNDEGEPIAVLDDISFDLHRSETLVVMGGSGCGKSTLLNCLIGEYEVDAGEIQYKTREMSEPQNLCAMSDAQLNELRKDIGILFQSGALFNSMTVAENIALPLQEHSYVDESVIDIVVKMKLMQVRMLPHRDKMPSQLSGGQKKRVGLARATALDPEILFYDEPSAGLDPVTSASIDELINDLANKLKVTSLVVTHEMDSAFHVADRMIMLDRGKVIHIGSREEFEQIRDAELDTLENEEQRTVHQFLNGLGSGPLTDEDGQTEFEQLLMNGNS